MDPERPEVRAVELVAPSRGADAGSGRPLVGRGVELARLTGHLDALRGDRGAAVALTGEPGIGKSALVEELQRCARQRGASLRRTAGVAGESQLPFAGLHRLLSADVPVLDLLAPPQRAALEVALGRAAGPLPELFLVGLAVLALLTRQASVRPVLVVVEDAHQLDPETTRVLAFVARRLGDDPVLLLATARVGTSNALLDAVGDAVAVGPLDEASSRTLLRTAAPDLGASEREQVLRWAGGNPLALLELPGAVGTGVARPLGSASGHVPTTERLSRAFATRTLGLGPATRAALLVAAVDDAADLPEVLAAASLVLGAGVHAVDLRPAVAAGLIAVDGEAVVFRHALVRAAVSGEASGAQLEQVHAALADVVRADPDRAAWHRASATHLPDADLAAALEEVAERARQRGSVSVALLAQQRAVALSAAGPARTRRLLAGAELAFQRGDRPLAEDFLGGVRAGPLDLVEQARVLHLDEAFDFHPWTAEGVRALVDRAAAVARVGAAEVSLQLLTAVVARSYLADTDEDVLRQVSDAAAALGLPPDHPGLLCLHAWAAPVARGADVLARVRRAVPRVGDDAVALRELALAAGPVGDPHIQVAAVSRAVDLLRATGRMSLAASALWLRADAQYLTGDWDGSAVAAAEAGDLALETSQPLWAAAARLTASHVAAARGDAEGAADLVRAALRDQPGFAPSQVQRARGLAAAAGERHEEAFEHLARIFTPGDAAFHRGVQVPLVADLAEAAAGCGRRSAARELLAGQERAAERTPSPLLHAGLALARALLLEDGDPEAAETAFAAATGPQLARWPFLWARAQLAHGELLRRRRQVARSRGPLRLAREEFDRLGAQAWGRRARRELRAAGERSPGPAPRAAAVLSPQELQIASLVGQGLTNRQVGDRLYLSHRTVSTYLHQVFRKLEISSRGQLHTALTTAASGDPSPPAGRRERIAPADR